MMALVLLAVAVLALAFVCLFVGSSHMSFGDCVNALLKKGSAAQVRIIWNIRIPRVLAAIIAGAGLSVSGLIMQTNLNNPIFVCGFVSRFSIITPSNIHIECLGTALQVETYANRRRRFEPKC